MYAKEGNEKKKIEASSGGGMEWNCKSKNQSRGGLNIEQ